MGSHITRDLSPRVIMGTAACQPVYAGARGLDEMAARALIVHACIEGVRWFDAAPTYGHAETSLGWALAGRIGVRVATKVDARASFDDTLTSVIQSQRRVFSGMDPRLAAFGVVQLHNATVDTFLGGDGAYMALMDLKTRGAIMAVGATVYGEDEALAAIAAGVDYVQVPFNLLDRRMAVRVFPAAQQAGTKVWVRSVWLRGALASPTAAVPAAVHAAADRLRKRQWCSWSTLASHALRYVFAFPAVTGVVIGPRTPEEVTAAVVAARKGVLSWYRRTLFESIEPPPAALVDPRAWDR